MIEPTAVPVSPLPSYWEYETTRRSCARCGVDGAAHQNREQSARWWGPGGFTLEFFETDFRSSGGSRLWLRSSEGRDYWIEGAHLDLAEPERMVTGWGEDMSSSPLWAAR